MSEKIYARLLRLYPSRFREAYGDEALQLFRDRVRHEKGFLSRLRLWLDLFADLAISLPREYYYFEPETVGAPAQPRLGGLPSFVVLEGGSPRFGALLSGSVLTLACLIAFSTWLSQPAQYRRLSVSPARSQNPYHEHFSASRRPAEQAVEGGKRAAMASTQSAKAAMDSRSGESKLSDSKPSTIQPESSQARQSAHRQAAQLQASQPDDAANTMIPVPGEGGRGVEAAEQHRVIHGAVANLKRYYVYPEIAQKTSDALLAHEKNGDYHAVKDGGAFADLLTKQMRDVSQDMHLDVMYSQNPLPEHPQGSTPESLARYREFIEHSNCTFEKVEILARHIGYLKLNSFPDPSFCGFTARAAMRGLNDADAIIFDLRDNRGGDPGMVMLLAAYLFDHPEYMYNPRENTTQQSWTRSPVPGNKLADKPVYILTSSLTSSAAEHFSYDLKMLKRGTLVGETTNGAAHSGVFHRLDEHFGMGIPETKPINPFSKSDWAVVGVEPDVKVKATDALKTAEKLARRKFKDEMRACW